MNNSLEYAEDGRTIIKPHNRSNSIDNLIRDEDGKIIIGRRKRSENNISTDEKVTIANMIIPNKANNDIAAEDVTEKIHTEKSKKDKKKSKKHKKLEKTIFHPNPAVNEIISNRFDDLSSNKKYSLNNDGDALFFSALYDGYVRFNTDNNEWYLWTGKQWRIDNDHTVKRCLLNTMSRRLRVLRKREAGKKRINHVLSCGNNYPTNNIMEIVKGLCVCHNEDFDSHRNLLNVKNGIVDLRTKELMPHSPKYMITKLIDVKYDPDAEGERFDKFISEICNDDESMANYLSAVYGYSITGETSEQVLFFEQGAGANGKSTLNNIICNTVFEYTDTVGFGLFEKTNSSANAPSPELAKLVGARLVLCRETDSIRINEAFIKELTGGTRITARALYSKPITFEPQFTMVIEANNLPTIIGSDNGIWRRIIVIPFSRTFKKNTALESELMQEKKRVLNWLIDGAFRYYKSGLPKCKVVKKATEKYHEGEDTVQAFIKYVLINDEGNYCPSSLLYSAYRTYCFNSSNEPLDIKKFKNAMELHGYTHKRIGQGIIWKNVTLPDIYLQKGDDKNT